MCPWHSLCMWLAAFDIVALTSERLQEDQMTDQVTESLVWTTPFGDRACDPARSSDPVRSPAISSDLRDVALPSQNCVGVHAERGPRWGVRWVMDLRRGPGCRALRRKGHTPGTRGVEGCEHPS